MKRMRSAAWAGMVVWLFFGMSGCNVAVGDRYASGREGVFVHISHGPEDPQRVLMALTMADLMSPTRKGACEEAGADQGV